MRVIIMARSSGNQSYVPTGFSMCIDKNTEQRQHTVNTSKTNNSNNNKQYVKNKFIHSGSFVFFFDFLKK